MRTTRVSALVILYKNKFNCLIRMIAFMGECLKLEIFDHRPCNLFKFPETSKKTLTFC